MEKYLEETELVNFKDENVRKKAQELAKDLTTDKEIAKACFLFVRDEIRHTGDYKDSIRTTIKASEVLEHKTGWCYSKSILLAALLRANGIPAGFGYQRLSCSEYKKGVYCLHGLNYVYLKEYGWYRVDSRGNKEGVDAQFTPPKEQLAFEVQEHEFDIDKNFTEPIPEILDALRNNKCYEEMVGNFPDMLEQR